MKKYIKGYEKLYSAHDDGRIYSHRKKVFLSPRMASGGYVEVILTKNGKPTQYRVQTLIAQTFLPNSAPEQLTDVDHINGDKTNNSVSNLEWVTHQENMKRMQAAKLNKKRKAVKHIDPAEFVKQYLEHGKNATKAIKVLDPDVSTPVAEVKGSRMLSNDKTQLLLQKIDENLHIAATRGSERLYELIESDAEPIAIQGIRTALEHTRPKQVEHTGKFIHISLGAVSKDNT